MRHRGRSLLSTIALLLISMLERLIPRHANGNPGIVTSGIRFGEGLPIDSGEPKAEILH